MSLARMAGAAFLSIALFTSPALAQDAAAGGTQFKARCGACHSVAAGQKALLAPNLSGVAGRKAGSTAFNYSPALKASGLSWDKATLDRFLAGPMKAVPGTRMVISVADAKQRADIVAYLSTLK
ncbi:MAG: c-type cytochrome [Sphingobium sp.]